MSLSVSHGFTLKSPYLTSAILRGYKIVENRSRVFKPGWYAVHTGKNEKSDEWAMQHVRDASDKNEFAVIQDDVANNRLPRGAIAGVCHITHALPYTHVRDKDQRDISPYAIGPYCMVISKTIWLTEAIPCRGNLGTWPLPNDVCDALVERLGQPVVTGADTRFPAQPRALQEFRTVLREQKRKRKRENDA